MSFRVGIILPKNINLELYTKIYNKYNTKLIRYNGLVLPNYYTNEEVIYSISEYGDDSNSGIGSYEIYNYPLNKVYSCFEGEQTKTWLIQDFLKRKDQLEKDANKWANIIKEILQEKNIQRIGIFHFDGHTLKEKIHLDTFTIINHTYDNIQIKDIINIGVGEIHFWNA